MSRVPNLTQVTTRLIVILLFVALPAAGMSAAPLAATAPDLGVAKSFAVLGGSTVTNTGGTVVNGDLGVWPGLAITGFFPPGIVVPPGTIHAGDAVAQQAQSDVTTAYNALTGQACNTDLTGQDLGGLTLTPGVYCFSSSAGLTGILTLNALGDPNAVWVFKIGSTLTTASGSSVAFINGGQSCNVFWQVGTSATLGTTTAFAGNILALASITLNNGASLNGRALARNGAVTMDTNTVTPVACAAAPTAIWTTKNDCGDWTQDVNHYAVGDVVYINGAFAAGTYTWSITGLPASCDPNQVVAFGTVTVDGTCSFTGGIVGGSCTGGTGQFCFPAYQILAGDCGEYQVKLDTKGDNYRVGPAELELTTVVEDLNGGQVLAGDTLRYTISYRATSQQTGVFIQDDYDETKVTFVSATNDANFTSNNGGAGGIIRWPAAGVVTLNQNASGTLTYTVTVNAGATGTIVNYVYIDSNEELPVSDTITVTVGKPAHVGAPVGGVIVPINRVELLAPWLGLAALAALTVLVTALTRMRGR
jgi:hypothetical protein